MSRRRKQQQNDRGRLYPSLEKHLSLTASLVNRLEDLESLYRRVNGVDLQIPKDIQSDFNAIQVLVARYSKNDLRHSESEYRSVKVLCQWTLDIKRELCNQERIVLEWND